MEESLGGDYLTTEVGYWESELTFHSQRGHYNASAVRLNKCSYISGSCNKIIIHVYRPLHNYVIIHTLYMCYFLLVNMSSQELAKFLEVSYLPFSKCPLTPLPASTHPPTHPPTSPESYKCSRRIMYGSDYVFLCSPSPSYMTVVHVHVHVYLTVSGVERQFCIGVLQAVDQLCMSARTVIVSLKIA